MAWPTTKAPRKNFVTLRLTDDEAADLDWLQGVLNKKDRSATVRDSLTRVVAVERRRAAKTRKASGTHEDLTE